RRDSGDPKGVLPDGTSEFSFYRNSPILKTTPCTVERRLISNRKSYLKVANAAHLVCDVLAETVGATLLSGLEPILGIEPIPPPVRLTITIGPPNALTYEQACSTARWNPYTSALCGRLRHVYVAAAEGCSARPKTGRRGVPGGAENARQQADRAPRPLRL